MKKNRFFFQQAGRNVTFANLVGHQPETLRPNPTYSKPPSPHPIFAPLAIRRCALCLGASVAKSALICVYLRLNSRFQTNSQRKSTVAHSRSTVDSGCELLIRSKKGLQPPASSIRRRSSYPITTTKRNRANQKPTETGQNLNRPTVDSGCEGRTLSFTFRLSVSVPLWQESTFGPSISFTFIQKLFTTCFPSRIALNPHFSCPCLKALT